MAKAVWIDELLHATLKELCANRKVNKSMMEVVESALQEKIKELETIVGVNETVQ